MSSLLKEFRAFILRGNLVDLAVAVVIGTAFSAVVTALVADVLTPLIAAVGGQPDFSRLRLVLNGSTFRYGHFLNALLAFVLVSAVIFFLVLKPVNILMAHRKVDTHPDAKTRTCPECLSAIPAAATRCAFCTSKVDPSVQAADESDFT
jgi:large conductance mechanosensitive channel